jgi:hypothetical protein
MFAHSPTFGKSCPASNTSSRCKSFISKRD